MDVEYELSTSDRFDALLLRKEQLAKWNEYYRKIHPAEAAEVDARLGADKAKAEVKTKVAVVTRPAAGSAAAPASVLAK
jgi:NADH-quinone oxidoreductase subunit I